MVDPSKAPQNNQQQKSGGQQLVQPAQSKARPDEIIYLSFNQDQGCFSAGTQAGFRVYNTRPYRDQFQRNFQGGIGIVEMLFRCNILALVGGGTYPKFPPNKVMLWDDHQQKAIGELSFKNKVMAVKLRKDKVVVVLEGRVYVYNFADLRLIDAIDTCNNPKGLCALNSDGPNAVLVTPANQKGYVRVAHYNTPGSSSTFMAHEAAVEAMVLNKVGDILATASETGTIIRLFKTTILNGEQQPKPFQEVRRGSTNANIQSLVFDNLDRCQYLACSSERETIHIFVVEHPNGGDQKKNPTGGMFGKILGSNESRSFAQLKIGTAISKCGFSEDGQSLVVITLQGDYYESDIPNAGGTMKIKVKHNLLDVKPNGQGQGGPN